MGIEEDENAAMRASAFINRHGSGSDRGSGRAGYLTAVHRRIVASQANRVVKVVQVEMD